MKPKNARRRVLWGLLGLPLACLLLVLASYLSNLSLPERTAEPERLSVQEKAQLAEFYHLKAGLGSQVWPGFGERAGPAILYNENYAFLVGAENPPDGWVKVPETSPRGGAWKPLAGETFDGRPICYQRVADPSREIGAFTVRIGEEYAPALGTLEYMRISLAGSMRSSLPPLAAKVFPYRIFPIGTFTAAWHVAGLQHEAFHAYQAAQAPQHLIDSELAEREYGKAYSAKAGAMQEAWKAEVELLQQGLRAANAEEALEIARRFLRLRAERRQAAGLSAGLVRYEGEREWLEGLAKYVELAMWRAASESTAYQPLEVAPGLESVNGYRGFQQGWDEQVRLLGRQYAEEGDSRFYFTGWAQAALLDWLSPGWKDAALQDGVYLEDLLAKAVR